VNRYVATTCALLASLLVTAPALWGAVEGRVDPTSAVARLLVALILCTGGASLFTSMVRTYHDNNQRLHRRRRDDQPSE